LASVPTIDSKNFFTHKVEKLEKNDEVEIKINIHNIYDTKSISKRVSKSQADSLLLILNQTLDAFKNSNSINKIRNQLLEFFTELKNANIIDEETDINKLIELTLTGEEINKRYQNILNKFNNIGRDNNTNFLCLVSGAGIGPIWVTPLGNFYTDLALFLHNINEYLDSKLIENISLIFLLFSLFSLLRPRFLVVFGSWTCVLGEIITRGINGNQEVFGPCQVKIMGFVGVSISLGVFGGLFGTSLYAKLESVYQ
jgi:hypothetical protein